MTIKELLMKYGNVEITEEQGKELKKLLKIKDNKKYKFEQGDKFYFIDGYGDIDWDYWNISSKLTRRQAALNNVFESSLEASFRLEQIKVYNELKNFADENNDEIDWNNGSQSKFYIRYDYEYEKLDTGSRHNLKSIGQIYFSSLELIDRVIRKVGEDRIKKYLFGVE